MQTRNDAHAKAPEAMQARFVTESFAALFRLIARLSVAVQAALHRLREELGRCGSGMDLCTHLRLQVYQLCCFGAAACDGLLVILCAPPRRVRWLTWPPLAL